jgi:hypothetical protein
MVWKNRKDVFQREEAPRLNSPGQGLVTWTLGQQARIKCTTKHELGSVLGDVVLYNLHIRVAHRERGHQRGQDWRYPLVRTEYQASCLPLRKVRDLGVKLGNGR